MASNLVARAHARAREAHLFAVLTLTCAACADRGASSTGRCSHDCFDDFATDPIVETTATQTDGGRHDASVVSSGDPTRDAAAQPLSSGDDPTDSGPLADLERLLAVVDAHMDYGYADDAVLHELSRTAGHAGAASCVCANGDARPEVLTGCALDEGANLLWSLPIDFAESMQCVFDGVERAAFDAYAACVIDLLEREVECYAEHRGFEECLACLQDLDVCPFSEEVSAAAEPCSPYLGDPPPRTRRILATEG